MEKVINLNRSMMKSKDIIISPSEEEIKALFSGLYLKKKLN